MVEVAVAMVEGLVVGIMSTLETENTSSIAAAEEVVVKGTSRVSCGAGILGLRPRLRLTSGIFGILTKGFYLKGFVLRRFTRFK